MTRFAFAFLAGLLIGVVGTKVLTTSTLTEPVSPAANTTQIIRSPEQPSTADDTQPTMTGGRPADSPASSPPVRIEVDTTAKIPTLYRKIIGPAVRDISFGERYEIFENEPVDEAWAYGMEAGMSGYFARLGPDTGTVFDFVQCRSKSCVLAGYVLDGYENQSARMVYAMNKEPWWQGGSDSSSTGGYEEDDFERFVIMFSRHNWWDRER